MTDYKTWTDADLATARCTHCGISDPVVYGRHPPVLGGYGLNRV